MKRPILSICMLLLLLSSCAKELDLKIAGNKEEIVLNSIFTAGEKARIELSTSAGTGGINAFEPPEFHHIFLYEDGLRLIDLENEELSTHASFPLWSGAYFREHDLDFELPFYQTRYSTIEEGKQYQVKVYVPGRDTIYGATIVPSKPELELISIVDSSYTFGSSSDPLPSIRIKLKIHDDGSEKNHYLLAARVAEDTIGPMYPHPYMSNDDILLENYLNLSLLNRELETYFNNGEVRLEYSLPAMFTNESFAGGSHEFTVNIPTAYIDADKSVCSFILAKITPDFYEHYRTSFQQREFLSIPFSEPTLIHSNIENGLGIVGGMATDTVWIPL